MCKDNKQDSTEHSTEDAVKCSDLSKGMMMAEFWKLAAPLGQCKRTQLKMQITLTAGEEEDNIAREEFLSWLFEKRPGSPSLLSCALKARASALFASSEVAPPRTLEAVWPKDGCPSTVKCIADEQLWQEILVKFGTSSAPAARDAAHFMDVIAAGVNPNSVPFPRMAPPSSRGKIPARPASGRRITGMLQDDRPFNFPCEMPDAPFWMTDAEKETVEAWSQGLASSPEELRPAFYYEKPMNMELTPWPVLPTSVIAEDECTSSQLQVWEQRAKDNPLSVKKVEKRRAALSKLLGEVNLRSFEEIRPELERDASFLEMRARWARDRALEARIHDEKAESGAAFIMWPVENERRWPALPAAWTQHMKWFKMWRQQSPGPFSRGPISSLKRSDSISSINSWLSVSDISWVEVESKAEEHGWQFVLDEATPALMEAGEGAKLCKGDISEIKCMLKPPEGVRLTMEVVCVLLGIAPAKCQNGIIDYWQSAKVVLGDVTFLERLLALQNCLPMSALEAVAPYISREDFTPEEIGKASKACASLCKWIRELYKYHVMGHSAAEAVFKDVMQRSDSELLAEAQRLLDVLDKRDIQELKSLAKPPAGVDMVCICLMHLLAGIHPNIELTSKGNVKEANWKGCKKLLASPDNFMKFARELPDAIRGGCIPRKNVEKARRIKESMGISFSVDVMRAKSAAASTLCAWALQIIAFYDKAAPPTVLATKAQKSDGLPSSKSLQAFEFDKRDLVEIKSMSKPPQPVMIICMCVVILKPLGREAENSGWAGVKAMLSDPGLLKAMQDYNVEKTTIEQFQGVNSLLDKEKEVFAGEQLKSVSKAAYGVLLWVRTVMQQYMSLHSLCNEEAL